MRSYIFRVHLLVKARTQESALKKVKWIKPRSGIQVTEPHLINSFRGNYEMKDQVKRGRRT